MQKIFQFCAAIAYKITVLNFKCSTADYRLILKDDLL